MDVREREVAEKIAWNIIEKLVLLVLLEVIASLMWTT